MKSSVFTILFICVWIFSKAQSEDSFGYATHISELFGVNDGGFFYDIAEDWNGFIWIATQNGLYRLDGTSVKHYTHSGRDTTLKHDQVMDIMVDHQKREIWLATAMGLSRLNPAKETIKHYQFNYENPNSLADNIVRYIYKDKGGKIWVACYNHGLSLYREETDDFQNFYYDLKGVDTIQQTYLTINESRLNSFKFIAQDKFQLDTLWLGTPRGLVAFRQSTGEFEWQFLRKPDDNPAYRQKSITFIYPMNGQLLIGTPSKPYIYDIDASNLKLLNPINEAGNEPEHIKNIYLTDSNQINIAFDNGLATYDLQQDQFERIWIDQPKMGRYHGVRLQDSNDRIWIHSSNTTVMLDPLKQVAANYLLEEQSESNPTVFRKINERTLGLLTSNTQNYHLFDTETHQWRSFELKSNEIDWDKIIWKDVIRVNSTKWLFIDETYIYELDPRTNVLTKMELDIPHEAPIFMKAILDSRGDLWVATRRVGLFRLNLSTDKLTHYLTELNSEFSSSLYTWIMNLHEDHAGNVWIRLGRSYAVYLAAEDRFIVFSHHKHPDKTFRYIRNFVSAPSGEVWMSSEDDGLGYTDQNALHKGVVQKLSTRNQLMSDRLMQIDFAADNLLWILSDKGFSTYDKKTSDVQNYTWDRGIPQTDQFITLKDGKIACLLKPTGISILDPNLLHKAGNISTPYITGIKVKDELIYPGGNQVQLKPLSIRPERDYLGFEFSALGYLNPKQFRYKLIGANNEEWVETYEHRSTLYSNLSPGDYTFLLQARFEGGEWSDSTIVNIYLTPYWWETIWFRIFMLFLVLGLGYGAYRWRIEDFRQKERLKTEYQRKLDEVEMHMLRSQMNPHFMFNSLNAIQLFIIRNDPKQAVSYLDKFARLMRLFLQNSRNKTVILKEELEALKLYMELERLRFKVKFDYHIEIAPTVDIEELEIPPMLLQPFIENAIWHGIQHKKESGKVIITISKENDQLVCTIQDDGVGRVYTKQLHKHSIHKHKSMGMQITQNRLNMLNQLQYGDATIEIIDLYKQNGDADGTKVVLRLPA